MEIPIGVANSVSANFGYNPLDTLNFARQSHFNLIQIFFNNNLLQDMSRVKSLCDELVHNQLQKIFVHAEGMLNSQWMKSDYMSKLFEILDTLNYHCFIIHYDEKTSLDDMLKTVERLANKGFTIYLENYFQNKGSENAEKNLRKFMALFTLANSYGSSIKLLPILDIPRFFHQKLEFDIEISLRWCFQLFNFFDNKNIPVLFQLIDSTDPAQDRNSYCPVGEGYIPYNRLFDFIRKNRLKIDGIILEFEDKINTLKSRDNLLKILD
jgi:hypothetical protein